MSLSLMPIYIFIHHLDNTLILVPVFIGAIFCMLFFERRYVFALFISAILTIMTTGILKLIFAIPRPIDMLIPTSGYSFPSFHASITAAVVSSLTLYAFHQMKNRVLLTLITTSAIIIIVLVDVSRVALHVHRPIDVIIGSALGVVISLLVHQYTKRCASSCI